MTNSVLEKNLLMPSEGAYVVENTWIGTLCEELNIRDNVFVTNGTPAVVSEDAKGMMFTNNETLTYEECMKHPHIPIITNPSVLPELPMFKLLHDGNCAEVLRSEGLKGLFGKHYGAGLKPEGYDGRMFEMRFDGEDFEGSVSAGASLHYDSLKPGTVTQLKGQGAFIKTLIPGAREGRRYIIRVYGRFEDPETAVCVFAHGKGGKNEARCYFGGSPSDYTCVDLPYVADGGWAETGVRIEQGRGSGAFYVDRMEVYQTDAEPVVPQVHWTFYGNAENGEPNGAGSAVFARVSSDDGFDIIGKYIDSEGCIKTYGDKD
jgi:hypothetical protein